MIDPANLLRCRCFRVHCTCAWRASHLRRGRIPNVEAPASASNPFPDKVSTLYTLESLE